MRGAKNLTLIVIILIIILAITIPSLLIFFDSGFAEIVMIPDGDVVFDKGFSEEIYNSGVEFEDDFEQEEFQYQFLPSLDPNLAVGYLETIFDNGGEVTISTSNEVLKTATSEYFEQNPNSDKHAIYLDDAGFLMDAYDNVLSINYLANEAGFIVGVISSIYVASLIENVTDVDSIDLSIGTWGGLAVPGVIQILSGFEQGINWFNYYFFGTDVYGNKVSETYESSDLAIEPLNVKPGVKIELYGSYSSKGTDYNGNPEHNNYYSGSFNVGEGETGASNLVGNGAKVLFPVAGGQTVDALSIANKLSKNNEVQIIGVDTDTSKTYENSPDYVDQILTSAIKDVKKSTYNTLAYLYGYSDSEDANVDYGSSNFSDSYLDGGWAYYGEDDYNEAGELVGASDKFLGTMENGGVGVTELDNPDSLVNQSWAKLFEDPKVASKLSGYSSDDLGSFLDYSMSVQQLAKNSESSLSGVEAKSNTFVDPLNEISDSGENYYYIDDKTDLNYIHDSSNIIMFNDDSILVGKVLPWIPDWNSYIE